MNGQPTVHWTARTLTAGTLLSAACFAIGVALNLVTPGTAAGDPRRFELVLRSAIDLHPWGWSTLGVLVLLATPAAGLVVTAVELRGTQPRAALLAVAVLVVLGVAVTLAMIAP